MGDPKVQAVSASPDPGKKTCLGNITSSLTLSLAKPENEPVQKDPSHAHGFLKTLGVFAAPFEGVAQLFKKEVKLSSSVSANPNSLYFGDVNIYTSTLKSFYINNNGKCKVQISLSTPYGFSVSPNVVSIPANSNKSITVTFTPYFKQNYSGHVSGAHGISVYVKGKGK